MSADVIDRNAPNRDRFNTTRWSVVLRARDLDTHGRNDAWNEIAQCYWYPLYAYSRRQGTSDEDAQDLTQGFFAHLLSGPRLNSISPEKGRFRTFLLTAFKNYVSNQYRDAGRIIRGGQKMILSLERVQPETRFEQATSSCQTAELAFERDWAESLLARVKQRLACDYQKADKSEIFAVLQPHLTPRNDAMSRAEIGQKLNLSPSAVGMSIHRMRRRFREILLEEVALTVDEPNEVENELRKLMSVFRSD